MLIFINFNIRGIPGDWKQGSNLGEKKKARDKEREGERGRTGNQVQLQGSYWAANLTSIPGKKVEKLRQDWTAKTWKNKILITASQCGFMENSSNKPGFMFCLQKKKKKANCTDVAGFLEALDLVHDILTR